MMKRLAALLLVAFVGGAAYGQNYKMIQDVVASGASDATNTQFHMRGTIGQSVIGPTAGATNVDQQGFWHVPGPGALNVGIEIGVSGPPADFQLHQNYPNPFNPTTTIRFSVPKRSHVVLHVISLTGALVKTLVDDDYAAGTYNVVFSATEIPTGTYLYTLESAGHVMTKRMILIK